MKYIYLSNALCTDVFPNNRAYKFTNYLNEELVLNGHWTANVHEMCYGSQSWYNIRSSNNKIKIRMSNILAGGGLGSLLDPAEIECEIPIREYLDGVDLMRDILKSINFAILNYFISVNATHEYDEWHVRRMPTEWVTRVSPYAKEEPYIKVIEHKGVNIPKALEREDYKLITPSDWDPARICGRYVETTMKSGQWRLQLGEVGKSHEIRIKLSSAMNMLLGFSKFNIPQLDWYEIIGGNGATAAYIKYECSNVK